MSRSCRETVAAGEALLAARGIPDAAFDALQLFYHVSDMDATAFALQKETAVTPEVSAAYDALLSRRCGGEPLQYIIGSWDFYRASFCVGPGVLIPRPETELLVAEGVRTLQEMDLPRAPRVLDLCTGSGCIAWSIALDVRDAEVFGVDLSETALDYARSQFNAGAPVFLQANVLDTEQDFPYGPFDMIVSNPPYVRESERAQMRRNVLQYEPDMALFVPDDDPLRFYRSVARWAQRVLRSGGVGIVEINEALGPETAALFRSAGLNNVQIHRDFFEKERFIRFTR